jgi:hypothetical protein
LKWGPSVWRGWSINPESSNPKANCYSKSMCRWTGSNLCLDNFDFSCFSGWRGDIRIAHFTAWERILNYFYDDFSHFQSPAIRNLLFLKKINLERRGCLLFWQLLCYLQLKCSKLL